MVSYENIFHNSSKPKDIFNTLEDFYNYSIKYIPLLYTSSYNLMSIAHISDLYFRAENKKERNKILLEQDLFY